MKKYNHILATPGHLPVTKIAQFGPWDRFEMGFHMDGKVIGGGELLRVRYVPSRKKTCLQTESTAINPGFRRKGHGIHLYIALVETAREVGAERIYSSKNLNRHSRRMWSKKLPKIYNVQEFRSRRKCSSCGCKSRHVVGYFIVLKGN